MKPATQKRTTRVKSTDEEVQIFVRNLNGKTMTVMVATSDTVESLLQKVEEKTGIPPSEQRILYAGKQLEPGRILADYNVEKESTLHLGASSFVPISSDLISTRFVSIASSRRRFVRYALPR